MPNMIFSNRSKKILPTPSPELQEAIRQQNLARLAAIKEETLTTIANLLLQVQNISPLGTTFKADDLQNARKLMSLMDKFAELDRTNLTSTFSADDNQSLLAAALVTISGKSTVEKVNQKSRIFLVYKILQLNLEPNPPAANNEFSSFWHEGLSKMLREMVKEQELKADTTNTVKVQRSLRA